MDESSGEPAGHVPDLSFDASDLEDDGELNAKGRKQTLLDRLFAAAVVAALAGSTVWQVGRWSGWW